MYCRFTVAALRARCILVHFSSKRKLASVPRMQIQNEGAAALDAPDFNTVLPPGTLHKALRRGVGRREVPLEGRYDTDQQLRAFEVHTKEWYVQRKSCIAADQVLA